jgi:ABC-type multidrug transport system fused ATPase/permease subunit
MFVIMRIAPKVSVLQGQFHNYNAFIPILNILDEIIKKNKNEIEDFKVTTEYSNEIKSSIKINNVSYSYPKEKIKAIDNVSMIIPAKSFTAFVGSSGSGKSTFANLLMGLMDNDSGEILLDGVNIKNINLDTYRSRIGFVSQENLFFNDTIKYNLTFGDNYKEKDIWEALKFAQIDDHIFKMPNKLNSIIGEAGLSLSGGQRQRLSIARSLLRNPDILVLDEASSALDTESEVKLQEAIEKISNNFTLIVIAHRLSTIKNAEKIYVFDKGSIIESGSYNELCNLNGRFTELNINN